MSDPTVGLLDTNIFVHAQSNDRFGEECRRFLALLEKGVPRAHLSPLVLHELSYALPRYLRQLTRLQVATYPRTVLSWPGIEGDTDLMIDAVQRWARTPGLGFVDAYLAALAWRRGGSVYTKNVREFAGQGVEVPQPLPI